MPKPQAGPSGPAYRLGDDGPSRSIAAGPEPAPHAPDVIEVISRSITRRADHVAVQGPDVSLTYAELGRLTNQLANRLSKMGIGRESRVGISMARGAGELVAMLATAKAGAAYVPLDPAHPIDRLKLVLDDATPEVVIVNSSSPLSAAAGTWNLLVLDDLGRATEGYDPSPPPISFSPDQLAYLLFTSGSTGRPKGVEITRSAFANFMRSMAREPGLTESDRLLAVSTTSFDIAGLELFLPLYVGATTIIADRATVMDPRRLRVRLESEGITLLQATPATWRLLLEAGWRGHPGLRMLCGGEALSAALADRLLEGGGELWNMYGPTETTVWSSLHRIRPGYDRISIGKPIDHTQIYVLDQERRPVSVGKVGELCIGGRGLARGYLGRPELTAERFVRNPPGDLIYRTGDLGRMAADGTFECLGRIDHQVKIRGYRVELGEIESVLRRVPQVREVLVVAEDQDGDPKLCVYWVGQVDREALVEAARRALPPYMVPSNYVRLELFPLTPNGKIDRKSLPRAAAAAGRAAAPLKPPKNDTETRLAAIWRQILARDEIGVDQDFFTLGGTSFLAVETCVAIEKETGVEIPLATFFESPTIEGLAPYIERERESSGGGAPIVVNLRGRVGDREPLFCLLGIHVYQELATALPDDQPVVGIHRPFLHVPGVGQHPTVQQMAAGYLELIRRRQPRGPYHLAGLCFGGIVAYEAARQLEAQGEQVASVTVLDAMLPGGARVHRLKQLKGYTRTAITQPGRVRTALGWGLAKIRDRLRPRSEPASPENRRLVDVDVDGPEADAEVTRFASSRTGIVGRLLVIRALEHDYPSWVERMPHLGWCGVSRHMEALDVPTTHLGLLHGQHVHTVAKSIASIMASSRRADASPGSPVDSGAVEQV